MSRSKRWAAGFWACCAAVGCWATVGCTLAQEPTAQAVPAKAPPLPTSTRATTGPGSKEPSSTTNAARAEDGTHAEPPQSSSAHGVPESASSAAPAAPAASEIAKQPWHSTSAAPSDWCTAAVQALDEETCYVLPLERTDELLIYLHGIVPPTRVSEQKTNFQKVVASAASRARVAALLPRGLPTPSGNYKRWWGWPSGEAYVSHVSRLLARFEQSRQALERLAGLRFKRIYVAGSSAGAYFVTALALRGDYSAQGFAAVSGGGGKPGHRFSDLPQTPFYIGYGGYDNVEAHARGLEKVLRTADWPVLLREHPTGHGAREVYLDEAFEFWRSVAPRRPKTVTP